MVRNVLYYLDRNAELFPNKIALEDEKSTVLYSEYREYAKRIGTEIIKTTKGELNKPIAVFIDRNVESIISFMGVVYSGNFYVPIDMTMPRERINLIFESLNPILSIDARGIDDTEYDAVRYKQMTENTVADENLLNLVRANSIDIDPLYAIFTSGSTGVPKGVLVSHRSVEDLVNAFDEAFGFPENSVFGNQAPFDFDVSVKDIFNSLKVCGTVQVIPKKMFKMPKMLLDYLEEKKISVMIWAVSALRIVSDFKALEESRLSDVRYIMFSGEVMPVKSLNYWMDYVPNVRYVNLYGPTEITCNCTYYEITKRFENEQKLPIGKAFSNCRVWLRDENKEIITETHKEGEICVEGSCLALGYWNNHEKTGEAFVQKPSVCEYPVKLYATGDIAYFDDNGDLVFASRKDYQIKHMGHRIELGEIEVALNAISFLDVACCVFDDDNKKIVCFYQAKEECKKQIVMELSKKLPKYMWPNVYVYYNELPLNKNGKIDRKLLNEKLKEN